MSGDGAAQGFFHRPWGDLASYQARASELDARFDRAVRQRAVDAVRAPTHEVARALEELVDRGGFFVTTGQQPGLFGGPMYSLTKGLSAIRLARELQEALGRPVVPLFWVASEDHDWEEAHDTWLVDVGNDLRHVAVERPDGFEEEPLAQIPLGPSVRVALRSLLEALPETDFSPPYVERLQAIWEEGVTLADAYRSTMEHLLGPLGMAFTTAHDPVVKASSVDTLRQAIEECDAHERALADRAAELESRGYHIQVPILPGGVNVFVEGPAGRERLYHDRGGRFRLRHSEEELSLAALLERLDEAPHDVTPNVLLRPIVEGVVFPGLAYVAGPGEISYYAQLAPLYDAFDVPMPVVYPRFTVTVVEAKIGKVLDKFGLDVGDLDRPFHEIAGEYARDEVPTEVEEILGRLRGAVGAGTADLQKATHALDATLKGPIGHARSAMLEAISDVDKKIVQASKREAEIALKQIEKAQLHLFPRGTPQERLVNPFYFLFRYGESFLHRVVEACGSALPAERVES